MTVDEMIEKKKMYGFSNQYIAEKSGIPESTVQKVFSKTTPTPRMSTLMALSKMFEETGYSFVAKDAPEYTATSKKHSMINGTSALLLDVDNSKTIDDYLKLPEGERVELIDGIFYDMAAPSFIHQRIAALIYNSFENHIKTSKGSCIPFIAPADVQLDSNDTTMVQPDVFVVCNRDKITRQRLIGTPDLIVEVLSESNWYTDMVIKRHKYKAAGVREYWIIMPDKLSIEVYHFERSDTPTVYSFKDKIPVGIWVGKCVVDFKEIFEKIQFML